MKHLTYTALVSALLASPLAAQDFPNLVGTWTGTSRAAVTAPGGHYSDGDAGQFVSTDFTLTWEKQDNGRLIGTIKSGGHQEPKVGVIAVAGDMFITADIDGSSIGRIIDTNSFELCYTQASEGSKQSVASCVVFKREGS